MVSCAKPIGQFQTGPAAITSTTVMATMFSAILAQTHQQLIQYGVLGHRGRLAPRNVDQVRSHEPATVLAAIAPVNHHKADLATKAHVLEAGVLGRLGQHAPSLADLAPNLEFATAMATTVLVMLRKTESATPALVQILVATVIFNEWASDIA